MNELLLGIDIGTSGCKITAIDLQGQHRRHGARPSTTRRIRIRAGRSRIPTSGTRSPADCSSRCWRGANAGRSRSPRLAWTVRRTTRCWPTATSGPCARPSCGPISGACSRRRGWRPKPARRSSGSAIRSRRPPGRCRNWSGSPSTNPTRSARTAHVLFTKDYVRHQLTGTWETDHIEAQGSLLYDMAGRCWSDDLCRLAGLPLSVLPPLVAPTDVVGSVTASGRRSRPDCARARRWSPAAPIRPSRTTRPARSGRAR